MADINFNCQHCNQNIDAPSDMAGETVECPACGKSIAVPVPQAPAQPEVKRIPIKVKPLAPSAVQTPPARPQQTSAPGSQTPAPQAKVSDKKRLAALLLCFFLGGLGVHRFYVGKVGTGIVQILTLGGLGIWTLIDFIMIIAGAFSDKKGLPVKNW
jgi:TM2 domain-containing membrane protein YozV